MKAYLEDRLHEGESLVDVPELVVILREPFRIDSREALTSFSE